MVLLFNLHKVNTKKKKKKKKKEARISNLYLILKWANKNEIFFGINRCVIIVVKNFCP